MGERLSRIGAVAAGFLLFGSGPGQSQALPPGLISGQVQQAYTAGKSWCFVGQGATFIQRNNANTAAVIVLPNLLYYDGTYHQRDGQAYLTFTSSTAGNIKFRLYGPTATATFNNYSQVGVSLGGTVTFNMVFPSGCSLPIAAYYQEAP